MSFETEILRRLASRTRLPVVQLLDACDRPTSDDLDRIDDYADGIGPPISLVLPRDGGGAIGEPSSLVRDAHRRPEVLALLDRLSGDGRTVVVVEWGWPGPYDGGLARICTRGSSAPGVAAVVEVLREAGWTR